jgi:hypothetical protein
VLGPLARHPGPSPRGDWIRGDPAPPEHRSAPLGLLLVAAAALVGGATCLGVLLPGWRAGLGVVIGCAAFAALVWVLIEHVPNTVADTLLHGGTRSRPRSSPAPVVSRSDPTATAVLRPPLPVDWDALLVELADRLRLHVGSICELRPQGRVLVLAVDETTSHIALEEGCGNAGTLDCELPGHLADERVRLVVEHVLAQVRDFVGAYGIRGWAPARLTACPRAAAGPRSVRAWYEIGGHPMLVLGEIPLSHRSSNEEPDPARYQTASPHPPNPAPSHPLPGAAATEASSRSALADPQR